ncbi:MAG: glycosyl hydrolase family 28-related protein, partial [Gemmataceae bacterium]
MSRWFTCGCLLALGFGFSRGAELPSEHPVVYPVHANVIDVTKPPYSAKGDGTTDVTAALQQAINDHTGHGRILYFPPGTYLVSATLTWPKKYNGHDNWGKTTLQGHSPSKSIIRLRDGIFTDTKKPQAIMWCGGFGSADWFHNHVQGLTFSVGQKNPGAIGLQFYSNNYGAVRNCVIRSEDGQGTIGLDLGHREMNGPLLVRRVLVEGFSRGIATANAV